ncbi:MAG: SMC-Scp complex subunit ScpB, partial [Chloroflexi bacterium]|nr:SMC-Scp complex subunit ScpB [Chloroflexota bacterium]
DVGRVPGPGRAVLFGTTIRFLEYFGLQKPDDLPALPEIAASDADEESPGNEEAEAQSDDEPAEQSDDDADVTEPVEASVESGLVAEAPDAEDSKTLSGVEP